MSLSCWQLHRSCDPLWEPSVLSHSLDTWYNSSLKQHPGQGVLKPLNYISPWIYGPAVSVMACVCYISICFQNSRKTQILAGKVPYLNVTDKLVNLKILSACCWLTAASNRWFLQRKTYCLLGNARVQQSFWLLSPVCWCHPRRLGWPVGALYTPEDQSLLSCMQTRKFLVSFQWKCTDKPII